MTSSHPCPTCEALNDLASRTPVELHHTPIGWRVQLPIRRPDSSRWSVITQQLGDALRDARSAVKR